MRRVALTLRDLSGAAEITQAHVAEAVQYRHRFLRAEAVPLR